MKAVPKNEQPLSIYVITYGTMDYGNRYVVREQRAYARGTTPAPGFRPSDMAESLYIAIVPLAVTPTLEEARAALPPGLFPMARHAEDDPVIVETWL